MLQSQRLSVQISEHRQELNQCIEERNKLPSDQEPSAEQVAKMDKLTKKLQALEVEYRAALTSEDTTENRTEDEGDAETRERETLLAESSLLPFLYEAMDDAKVDGREAECRAAILGDRAGRLVPVDLLMPPGADADLVEHRVDAVTTAAGADTSALAAAGPRNQADVLPRIFTRSIAARLGVSMPSVPAGQSVYPVMTAGTTAAMVADAARHDAVAGRFTSHTLEPTRLTGAYLFNVRQTLQLRNFEAVLRRDLAAVMADAMDDQIVNGDGTGSNVTGFLAELPAVNKPTTVTDWSAWLDTFTGLVDGLNAFGLSDLRAVVGKQTFQFAAKLFRSDADGGPVDSAYDYTMGRGVGQQVSSRIADASGSGALSNTQVNIAALTSYPGRNAVAPIWRGMELIRDPYTKAGEGQVRLTAVMFWSFKILREAGWTLWPVRLS